LYNLYIMHFGLSIILFGFFGGADFIMLTVQETLITLEMKVDKTKSGSAPLTLPSPARGEGNDIEIEGKIPSPSMGARVRVEGVGGILGNCRKCNVCFRFSETATMTYNLLVILGPTASGKTRVAVQVAGALKGEIISADSRQVHRGMDIGTGKDLQEYGSIPYHLIDVVDPGYEFNVFEFQRRFAEAFRIIHARRRLPLLVGGTGMYLDSVLGVYPLLEVPENFDLRQELAAASNAALAARLKQVNPKLHNTTDLLDRQRLIRAIEIAEFQASAQDVSPLPELSPLVFGMRWAREDLRRRITRRLKERLNHGLIEEVDRLHKNGVPWEVLDFYGLEYRFVSLFLKGSLNRNDMFQKLNSAIHQLAKRQETWFRRMERRGIPIHWVEGDEDPGGAILKKLSHH